MKIHFTKMHGLGNDFVVIDAIHQQVSLTREQVRFLADRHFGVGCDQLLLVESSNRHDAEFFYRIYNADGGEVHQCGNGARCFARFVLDSGMTDSRTIPVETAAGLIRLTVEDDGEVTVDMGTPSFLPGDLPFRTDTEFTDASTVPETHEIVINGEKYAICAVSIGNPHVVLVVDSVEDAPVAELGPAIESHERFPERVNAGFMEIVDRAHIRLRVYERGAGETLACGSGACAAVAVGIRNGLLDEQVEAELTGGELTIRWSGENNPLFMTGPATTVYKGQITL